ncbi:hypothetical protein EJD97_002268 [Solanum chilense]|uniref:Uncharacterized protein n=1 Tax=Solanum chilense TaxID=4083 RepID=A0A6N2BZ65_SOLCI|nr:hypothetical protein EJD97_002268 [Solanum chilense]
MTTNQSYIGLAPLLTPNALFVYAKNMLLVLPNKKAVVYTNIMAPVKRKLDISDTTKIQKKARSKIDRMRNENTILLEDLASEAVCSSQVELEFCQKEYEEREVVEEEEEKQKEVEEEQGKAIEVVNREVVESQEEKINEVEEEQGKNIEVVNREVVETQKEKINEVEEEQELHEVFKATSDDAIKIINADTFLVHLQPNANGDSIIRSVLGKPFIKFRDILNKNNLEDFSRNSCFDHFLDLPIDTTPRFQMIIVYELLKRRFIF